MNPDELHETPSDDVLGMQQASAEELLEEEAQSLPETAKEGLMQAFEAEPLPSLDLQVEAQTLSYEPSAQPEHSGTADSVDASTRLSEELAGQVAALQQQEHTLRQEIAALEASRDRLQDEVLQAQSSLGRLVQEGLKELEQRRQALQISVEQLERRQERIRSEMRTSFAGASQDVAIRVQSFKDYLVGSLQDLALAAEQLNLPKVVKEIEKAPIAPEAASPPSPTPKFAEQSFQEQTKKIRGLIDQYRNRPDYYGSPWQLRRTFEPIHAERVSNWFFTQGGRGAIRTMGSRLQNILVASATISIAYALYGDRLRALILAQSPERLGEWRRGLQDCLGITRSDFGPDRGVALFEDPEPLAQKADRMMKDGLLPLIIIDETEEQISLSMLQFPLWLAFAPNPQVPTYSY